MRICRWVAIDLGHDNEEPRYFRSRRQAGRRRGPLDCPRRRRSFLPAPRRRCAASFRTAPGVYLFQDQAGRVMYIGKATTCGPAWEVIFLRRRRQTSVPRHLVREAYDVDFVEAESDVDALLMEARLVKDIQPKYNRDLRDDKSFPYLQITTHEDYPRVEVTREPRTSGAKLYGPFANAGSLRGAVQVLQKVFKFRTCSLDIEADDERWRWFRPCLLASINQCTAPCNLRISKEEYRKDIKRLRMFLEGNRKKLLAEMRQEMAEASANLKFEQAARLRDEIHMLESLRERGELDKHEQPEVFFVDPKKGLAGLQKILKLQSGRGTSKASTSPTWAATKRSPALCNSSMACRSSRAIGGIAFATSRASTITRASAKWWPGGFANCVTTVTCFPTFCWWTAASASCEKRWKHFVRWKSSRRLCSRWPREKSWFMRWIATSRCG